MRRFLSTVLMAASLIPAGWWLARACAPDFLVAVFSYYRHPDLPRTEFIDGRLGVLQPSFARSYLIVAYRYLNGVGLSAGEREQARDYYKDRATRDWDGTGTDWASAWQYARARIQSPKAPKVRLITTFVTLENAFTVAHGSVAPISMPHDFRNPYAQEWNFNIQEQLPSNFGLMVGYFGTKGTNLDLPVNINQFINGVRPYPALATTSPIDPGLPLANIISYESAANSDYNALWITVTKRFSKGLQLNSSYTFSKSIDDASRTNLASTGGPQNSYDIRGDRGLSDFDARHRWVFSGIYDLPYGGSNRLAQGWRISTIVQLQSGNPLNFHTSNTSFTGLGTLRPSVTGPVDVAFTPSTDGNATRETYIQNPSVFYCGTAGNQSCTGAAGAVFGNLGRNVIIGPGFANVDLALVKDTKITERITWEIRAEAFDLLNHANFSQTGANPAFDTLGGATFALLTATRNPPGDSGSSRQLQLAMKLIF
jgi:hypothetical protein